MFWIGEKSSPSSSCRQEVSKETSNVHRRNKISNEFKQMRDVKKQRGSSSGKIGNNENTVNIEKIVPPVPARK